MRRDWRDDAACRLHYILPPDAWHEVEGTTPVGLGIEALAVCQHECDVWRQCRQWMEPFRPLNTIAGRGWWDGYGVWHDGSLPPSRQMDSRQVAIYLGIRVDHLFRLLSREKIESTGKRFGKRWYTRDEVERVHREVALPHGTSEQYQGHIVRGEAPCSPCAAKRRDFIESIRTMARETVT